MVLSPREKLLVALLVVVLVLTGAYFGGRSLLAYEQALRLRLRTQEAFLRRAEALHAELARMRQRPAQRRRVRTRPLIGYVEQLAGRTGLQERIQLNMIPRDTGTELEGVDVKVDRLTLDELVNFVYTLENADYRLVIDRVEISPSFRDKELLRLSMRVLGRE